MLTVYLDLVMLLNFLADFLLLLVLCLVVVVPGGVMWIRYGFVKGTDGYNRYGPDPTK